MEKRTESALTRAIESPAHRKPATAPRGGLGEPCTLTQKDFAVINLGINSYVLLADAVITSWNLLAQADPATVPAELRRDTLAMIERALTELESLKPFIQNCVRYVAKYCLLHYRVLACADDIQDELFRREISDEFADLA